MLNPYFDLSSRAFAYTVDWRSRPCFHLALLDEPPSNLVGCQSRDIEWQLLRHIWWKNQPLAQLHVDRSMIIIQGTGWIMSESLE